MQNGKKIFSKFRICFLTLQPLKLKIAKMKFNTATLLLLIIAVATTQTGCKEKIQGCTDPKADNYNSNANEDDGTCTYSKKIGESFGGGIIFYVDISGQHGLIAAPSDISDGIQWYNGFDVRTYATNTLLFKGKQNTNMIVAAQGDGSYAAKLCQDLVLNGYDDWYLPSKSEIKELYDQRVVVGGFANDFYWSSSENDNSDYSHLAWYHNFTDGYRSCNYKNYQARVRPIRQF